jgi:hypothetical protein
MITLWPLARSATLRRLLRANSFYPNLVMVRAPRRPSLISQTLIELEPMSTPIKFFPSDGM